MEFQLDYRDLFVPLCKRFRLSSHATNVTPQTHRVTREQRALSLGKYPKFRGCTIWFTGLSGSGKTTVSFAIEQTLCSLGIPAYGLDGDNLRHGICSNLGFSEDDRQENIRRAAEVAKLFADMGVVLLASFISPFEQDRRMARSVHEQAGLPFIECYLDTPLEVCEQRDPKGLYQMARFGKISNFTGIDSVYEVPSSPELVLHAGRDTLFACVRKVLLYLCDAGIFPEEAFKELTGDVVDLFADRCELDTLRSICNQMETLQLSDIDMQWLQVLAEGWATPLRGFMTQRQYLQTLHFNQLLFDQSQSTNQSVPIVLAISDSDKTRLRDSECVALTYKDRTVAILSNVEIYAHRKEERCARQFGIHNEGHPTVKMIMESGDWLIGGDVKVFERIQWNDGLDEYRLTPMEIRQRLSDMKADAVFAFQLRNPIHNGHALLLADTREKLLSMGYRNPVLLLHPLGGWTKDDDVPLKIRIDQHLALFDDGVLDRRSTLLAIFPSPMLYAGPTEVQWHAKARLAAGVQYYIVGRDPAGIAHPDVGGYLYDPTHGAQVLSMAPGLGNLHILPFRVAAYDRRANRMDYFDPERADDFDFISGTRMRQLAREGRTPPDGFMAPKAWQVLADFYKSKSTQ